jgi:CRP/FNR family cyclic AMP-dependent transcriptional regulator
MPAEPAYIQQLLGYCHARSYRKHSVIVRQGDPADSLFLILSGSVRVVMPDDGGHEVIITYLNAGDFFGEMGLFAEEKLRSVSVIARTEAKAARIGYQQLEQLLEGPLKDYSKDILFHNGRQLTRRLNKTNQRVNDLATLDVTGRLARALLELAEQPDAMTHPLGMQISVTRQDLGKMVGCSREMAGRVLKTLEEQQLIEASGKRIVVYHVGPMFADQATGLSHLTQKTDP